MIVPIRLFGDECLKEEAYNAELEEGDNIVELVQDLFETLKTSGSGVGLAATQIGVPLRVFVLKYNGFELEFINPVILSTGDSKSTEEEGCLSIPNVGVKVERYDEIRLQYSVLDEDGNLIHKDEGFEDYIARIIQHEIDHLDGICITDKVKGIAKTILQPKLKKIRLGRTQYRYPTLHKSNPDYKGISEEIINKYIKE
jgi:peptide deformylase